MHAEETGTQATLTINPVLSLGLDSAVTMSVQPTSTGEFTSGSAELTVSTNNETGYSLYLSTANGKATLDSINPATTTAVQPVSGTVAADGFGANTWGYNLDKDAATDATTYQAVPTTATAPQATTAGPTLGDGTLAADTYNLNFGALINSDLPSGTYTNTVTVSVVANPAFVLSLDDITNMQEMTPEICEASAENEVARLIDTRDGNDYSVAKINGTCWMTQNLRIASGTQLTSADSNLPDGAEYAIPTADLTYNSYTRGLVHAGEPSNGESATDTGYWYNYCAASAGQVCSSSQQQNATQDICPKGWRLPTRTEQSSIAGFTYLSAFAPVTGGYYNSGTLGSTDSGNWWSSTAFNNNLQCFLSYDDGGSLGTGYRTKFVGYYVRCVRSS